MMAFRTLAVFLFWTATMTLTTTPVRAQQVMACAPNCTVAAVGDKVRVPWNCAQYAVCVDLHDDGFLYPADPIDCPHGEYFEPSHDIPRCDPIDGAEPGICEDLCNPCEIHCTVPGTMNPDPTNCSIYHVCVVPGAPTPIQCTDTPNIYYDFTSGTCQSDPSRCFDQFCSVCDAHCTVEGNMADPYDCTKFYYCNPPVLVHGSCPPGEHFSRTNSVCSAAALCIDDCT